MKIINPNFWSNQPKLEVIRPPKAKLCIITQEGHQLIFKNDITCLIADSNYTIIHINDHRIICSQTLSIVLDKIGLPTFIRTHKSYVVNINKIKHIDNAFTTITTDCGIKLSIARSRKQEIKNLILSQFD